MSVIFVRQGVRLDSEICHPGLNLLGHAQMIELGLGSECGGHGKCGRDRVLLEASELDQVNAPTAIERAHLKPEELKAGYRLACQCFPNAEGLSLSVKVLAPPADSAIPRP
jgi:ferredoxin